MPKYEWQRWIFKHARKHGWEGREPSILGTQQADTVFENAKQFLIDKGITYKMANIWFSGTCKQCGTWSGVWEEYSTTDMRCPDCGALQSVKLLELNQEKKQPQKLG